MVIIYWCAFIGIGLFGDYKNYFSRQTDLHVKHVVLSEVFKLYKLHPAQNFETTCDGCSFETSDRTTCNPCFLCKILKQHVKDTVSKQRKNYHDWC